MDNFITLAKHGIEAYENHQRNRPQTHSEGQENQTHGESHGDQPRGEGHGDQAQDRQYREQPGVPQLHHDEVVNHATSHSGNSDDSNLFSDALKHLSNQSQHHTQPIDEEHVTNAHKKAYENGNASHLDASGMGAAAALQAFKSFTSSKGSSSAGGGGSSQLISLAMGEAAKLFEKCGGSKSGGKQDVINSAAATMMKLVVQSKLGKHGTIGGGDSGGLGSLMGLASKLL